MDRIRVVGGPPLEGTVRISGAKNVSLPALCATLLTHESPFLNGAVINLDGGISHVLHDPD